MSLNFKVFKTIADSINRCGNFFKSKEKEQEKNDNRRFRFIKRQFKCIRDE